MALVQPTLSADTAEPLAREVPDSRARNPKRSSFRRLEAARIVETAAALELRIDQRFPKSGLSELSREIHEVAVHAAGVADWAAKPHWVAKSVSAALTIALLSVVGMALHRVRVGFALRSFADMVQGVESSVNNIVFLGVAIVFVWSLETRRKRRRVVQALHELRSFAHIVDMEQLTQAPDWNVTTRACDSAESEGSAFMLTCHLDYCSELLAIISKIAALYVQELIDPTTVSAANAVESLCVGLSRTIWQKIMFLQRTPR